MAIFQIVDVNHPAENKTILWFSEENKKQDVTKVFPGEYIRVEIERKGPSKVIEFYVWCKNEGAHAVAHNQALKVDMLIEPKRRQSLLELLLTYASKTLRREKLNTYLLDRYRVEIAEFLAAHLDSSSQAVKAVN
ncbi:MAG: hypothetical protein ACRBFS_24320 [Aureispira sp.]